MLPELASWFTRAYTRLILRSPSLTVLVLVLVTLLLLKPALTFEQNMTRDIEVYLPEGEESTDLLLEVRKDWATDIIIIYIETRNANDPERFNDRVIHNITYVPTLKEIARLEQQIDQYGQSMDQDKYQADRGIQDDIIFTLSISTLIKEFNSTDARFIEATEGKVFGGLSVEQRDDELVNETGRYAIPSDQDRVDQIYAQTSGALQNFAIDTNGDGILDTAYIMFALKYSIGDNDARQAEIIANIQQVIDSRPSPARTEMTQTGLVVVLHEVTERLYEDLLAMLPISLIIVLGMMLWFHRNVFVIPVVLIPIFCALIWTLGLVRISGVVLTPMIVAANPSGDWRRLRATRRQSHRRIPRSGALAFQVDQQGDADHRQGDAALCTHRYDWLLSTLHLADCADAYGGADDDSWRHLFVHSDGEYDSRHHEAHQLHPPSPQVVDRHCACFVAAVARHPAGGAAGDRLLAGAAFGYGPGHPRRRVGARRHRLDSQAG
ncbi:MAG TPA: hypothetical protein EYQ16_03435 [Marine Group III euryarchaeote]|uniref:Membrane transport protein MMPL domain-containing protein n=1 Tax=Marine Group III euryarchaeote TaxID=2173149 RepID=A0A7C7ZFB0_9ARCH|nr:hypothetical protein [Marine Group III euryarchaeote]